MKHRRTTNDYAAAIGIIQECYAKNGGQPMAGSIRTYCIQTNRADMASTCTVVHASLIKLGILVKDNGRYRFTDDPTAHLDDVISRYSTDKKKSQAQYEASLAKEQPRNTAVKLLERIKRDTQTLCTMGYQQDDNGRWYKETREYL